MADKDFYRGVICALAVVHGHDEPVIFDDIVKTMDKDYLIKVAREDGNMSWSGLSIFLRDRQSSEEPQEEGAPTQDQLAKKILEGE